MNKNAYVIITPAHNEAAFIEKTILSVISQTILPLKWVVVNDASTDETAEIVKRYQSKYSFIQLVNVERAAGRHFGNKVRAFNQGLSQVRSLDFEFIGNLDADISMDGNYFESILREYAKRPKMGIAGGMVHSQVEGEFVSQEVATDSVAGAVQLFRRECFETIGGYTVLPLGGIDAAAEIAARMNGWQTRTFPEYPVKEHRRTGSATASPLSAKVKEGRRFHSLGYGFCFFAARCVFRLLDKPRILGSIAAFVGYVGRVLSGEPVSLPPETVRYLRMEQRAKLKNIFRLSRRVEVGNPVC